MLKKLKEFIESPYLSLFTGLLLVATSLAEVIRTIDDDVIGSHHGILVFGIVQILSALPEIVYGLKDMSSSGDKIRK